MRSAAHGQRRHQGLHSVFAHYYHRFSRRPAIPGIDMDHWNVCRKSQRLSHLASRIPWRAAKFVYGYRKRRVAVLEEVNRHKAVLQAEKIYQYHRADGPAYKAVPHEPEPALI